MVYRVYVSKKEEFAGEDRSMFNDLKTSLGIKGLRKVKIYNRYDIEGVDKATFETAVATIFSEPQVDDVAYSINLTENTFATELLPGQFDQRADSAQQCVQFVTGGHRPVVKFARVIKLFGHVTKEELEKIKKHIINPVESRLASLEKPKTLETVYPRPEKTPVLEGFTAMAKEEFAPFIAQYGLAMDADDLAFCQEYFRDEEHRDPTLTELRMIDTYWSDHCRHTTFNTILDEVTIEHDAVKASYEKYLSIKEELYPGKNRPLTLMDLATVGAKYLKRTGKLKNLDESEEINACSVKINVKLDNGKAEKWLLMFKNETHNHPTEIEPFGGAATCLGGAIRDPLSGRSYVYQAMRLTGAANPLAPLSDTLKGKLPQSKICQTASAGYSSYGNQIGLATGHVAEVYHPGYVAKRMEVGAVMGAAPAKNVVRKTPQPGDVVILLGGATGRDGCGGATGSSKAHNVSSLEECGAEVQKGNAPEERKIQRLFRDSEVTRMIKRCNDFGAGGVSVAIGELADSLSINLDVVPKKYEGLTATELAISESQERMAVVVSQANAAKFIKKAEVENLSAVKVALVTDTGRLEMFFEGEKIVDLSRAFLNSAGAVKFAQAAVTQDSLKDEIRVDDIEKDWTALMADLNVASQRGLVERFDATIGAGTVLMPYGGKYQSTPAQAMSAMIPTLGKTTSTASLMAWGFDPYLASQSPYYSAYYAVISSAAKMIAAGGSLKDMWMSFQEYFERLGKDKTRWGKPFAALLGALEAQLALGVGSIGGKDSMSGSFENIDVPPTLISFAAGVADAENIISPEFKAAGHYVYFLAPEKGENGLYKPESLIEIFEKVTKLIKDKKVVSAWATGFGGVAEAVTKMAFGNHIGIKIEPDVTSRELFGKNYGGFVIETVKPMRSGKKIGVTIDEYKIKVWRRVLKLDKLEKAYNATLEPIYPTTAGTKKVTYENLSWTERNKKGPAIKVAQPKVLIPVFPGTNCEYDTARAFEENGAKAEILVIRNNKPQDVLDSAKRLARAIRTSQIIALPGGFSGGDEPDGSAKFIVSLLRNPEVANEIEELLHNRDGLMCGICNGFQALIKLGLVPYGHITAPSAAAPTLTFNSIGRHQSRLVRTRVASVKSPWLMHHNVGDINTIAISHGEGRFIATQEMLAQLITNGQIATQYVDLEGNATSDIDFCPNNSMLAVEGITSPDGRVFGKMGHSERTTRFTYKNVPDTEKQLIFKGAVDYFTK
ncbi:MAG: phosphoribosylformylglycinamidine synthase [Oscillospiraceae bacterium]|nr:phosphoribosylformylglycinamidine synthase [Oscillospiraceae bacterium]